VIYVHEEDFFKDEARRVKIAARTRQLENFRGEAWQRSRQYIRGRGKAADYEQTNEYRYPGQTKK
jgi:hypothetical protein